MMSRSRCNKHGHMTSVPAKPEGVARSRLIPAFLFEGAGLRCGS